jgi:REP element-mobilizing transposase RayT
MPSRVVPLITDEVYHVFNRGVDKRIVFTDKKDYLRFYQSLHLFNSKDPSVNFDFAHTRYKNNSEFKKLVEIQAYSLLPNHFHLIIKQCIDGGIGEYMRRVSTGYTSYFNQRNERSGALFQGRFKRVHINSQEQYQYLFAYVNENHSVHNLDTIREICHSSSLHYQKLTTSKLINSTLTDEYPLETNMLLAKDIYLRREDQKINKAIFE